VQVGTSVDGAEVAPGRVRRFGGGDGLVYIFFVCFVDWGLVLEKLNLDRSGGWHTLCNSFLREWIDQFEDVAVNGRLELYSSWSA
jgi:hypothetical protein